MYHVNGVESVTYLTAVCGLSHAVGFKLSKFFTKSVVYVIATYHFVVAVWFDGQIENFC